MIFSSTWWSCVLLCWVSPLVASFENSCERLGTATLLNDLYFNVEPDCDTAYKCSGLLLHGDDWSLGSGSVLPSGVETTDNWLGFIPNVNIFPSLDSNDSVIPTSLDVDKPCPLYDPEKPQEEVQIPAWCPSPVSAGVSMTYMRADVPSVPWELDLNTMFVGPKVQDTTGNDTFWDEDRLMAAFISDGGTYNRLFCGVGPDKLLAQLGIGGEPIPRNSGLFEQRGYLLQNCPHPTDSQKMQDFVNQFASNWSYYCPKQVQSADDYFAYQREITSKLLEMIHSNSTEAQELKNLPLEGSSFVAPTIYPNATTLGDLLPSFWNYITVPDADGNPSSGFGNGFEVWANDNAPRTYATQCALDSARFSLFLDAARDIQRKAEYVQSLFSNEILINIAGVSQRTMMDHMVFYQENDEAALQKLFRLAEVIQNTTGVSIPIVTVNKSRTPSTLENIVNPSNEVPFACAEIRAADRPATASSSSSELLPMRTVVMAAIVSAGAIFI